MSEVVALRQEIADRQKVDQDDREADRRQIRGAPAAPSDAPRSEQLEGIHDPAQERHEDLRMLGFVGLLVVESQLLEELRHDLLVHKVAHDETAGVQVLGSTFAAAAVA